jgi:hypothetical protein
MKYPISLVLVIVVPVILCANAQTSDPLNGTWKLNAAKSQVSPADLAQKSATTRFEVTQDAIKMVNDAVDVKGRATHAEYTAQFDGKDYPWKGTVDGKPNPDQDAVAVQRVDSHTYLVTNKLKGQTLTILRIVVAADGKSRTNTLIGKTVQGQPVNVTMVYEKQ